MRSHDHDILLARIRLVQAQIDQRHGSASKRLDRVLAAVSLAMGTAMVAAAALALP
jgi:hypothetical protein